MSLKNLMEDMKHYMEPLQFQILESMTTQKKVKNGVVKLNCFRCRSITKAQLDTDMYGSF